MISHTVHGFQKVHTPPKPAYGIRITQIPKEVWPQVRVRQPAANKHDTEHEMDNCHPDVNRRAEEHRTPETQRKWLRSERGCTLQKVWILSDEQDDAIVDKEVCN